MQFTYVGNAIANNKVVTLSASNPSSLTGRKIQLGLGNKLLEFTGYNPTLIATTWNDSTDNLLKTVFAEVSGEAVMFTSVEQDEDFQLKVLVDQIAGTPSAVHTISFSEGTLSGTFTILLMGQTTGNITYSATPATLITNISSALEALSNIAPGDVVISSPSTGVYRISYAGAYLEANVPLLAIASNNLTGGNASITVSTSQEGSAGVNEVQNIVFDVVSSTQLNKEVIRIVKTNNAPRGNVVFTLDGVLLELSATHTGDEFLDELYSKGDLFNTLDEPDSGAITQKNVANGYEVTFGGNLSGVNIPNITHETGGEECTQIIDLKGATGGTFRVYAGNSWTSTIAYNAASSIVDTAIEANVGSDNVVVTGSNGGPYNVRFTGDLTDREIPLMLIDGSQLTGVPSGAITTVTQGVPGTREKIFVWIHSNSETSANLSLTKSGTVSGGTFKFNIGGTYTPDLPYNATHHDIYQAIGKLWESTSTPKGSDNCMFTTMNPSSSVSVDGAGVYHFIGDLGSLALDISAISLTTSLTGGGNYSLVKVNGTTPVATITIPSSNYSVMVNGTPVFLNFTDSIEYVKTAFESNPNIGVGNINVYNMSIKPKDVAAGSFGLYCLELTGALSGPTGISFTTTFTHPSRSLKVKKGAIGSAGTNEVQRLTITGSLTSNFTLSGNGLTTQPCAYNSSAAAITSRLEEILGVGNVLCSGGSLPGTAVDITFKGIFTYTNVPELVFNSPGITPSITYDDIGSIAPTYTLTVVKQGGSETVYNTVGSKYCLEIKPVGGTKTLVPNIPYTVSSSTLASMINTSLGFTGVSCSGGDHPLNSIAVTFTGTYQKTPMEPIVVYPQHDLVEVYPALKQASKTNVYRLVVIPDEGTLGVNYSALPLSRCFFLNIATDQAPETSTPISISIPGINAKRIEGAINEHFGRPVVQVVKVISSVEFRPVKSVEGTYSSGTKVFYTWYYRGEYELTFINEFSEDASITGITLALPQKTDGSGEIDPYDFMTSAVGTQDDDLSTESSRVAFCFQTASSIRAPIHYFSIYKDVPNTDNNLQFTYNVRDHRAYGSTTTGIGRANFGVVPSGTQLYWSWCSTSWSGGNTLLETPEYTELAKTDLLDFYSTVEQHKSALASMLRVSGGTTDFFGESSVEVTGSLINSWKPDYQGTQSTANLEDLPEDKYSDLKVTLIGKLGCIDLYREGFFLKLTLVSPYSWQSNPDNSNNSIFKKMYVDGRVSNLPLKPQRNKRVRCSSLHSSVTNDSTVYIGYQNEVYSCVASTSLSLVEEGVNSLSSLFKYNSVVRNYGTVNNVVTPPLLPKENSISLSFYGTTLKAAPFEVVFSGGGLQYLENTNLSIMGGLSKALVTTSTEGVLQKQEVQVLTMTPGVSGGTFTATCGSTSSSLAYNISNASLKTALEGLSSIGSNNTTLTGGPLYQSPVTVTFNQSLNNVPSITITPSLNNGVITVTNTATGGITNALIANETVVGSGPSYFLNQTNWSPLGIPGSGDTIVFDDCEAALRFNIKLQDTFKVIDALGTLLLTGRTRLFSINQKVKITTTGSLPSEISTGYYYIVESTGSGSIKVSATQGGTALTPANNGSGIHTIKVDDLRVRTLKSYVGAQIGLPRKRSDGVPEYLPCYFTAGFTSIILSDAGGDFPLKIGKFNTGTDACVIVVHDSETFYNDSASILLLTDNGTDTTLRVISGSVGLSVYSDESSEIKSIQIDSGLLILNNCTVVDNISSGINAETRTYGVTSVGGIINI